MGTPQVTDHSDIHKHNSQVVLPDRSYPGHWFSQSMSTPSIIWKTSSFRYPHPLHTFFPHLLANNLLSTLLSLRNNLLNLPLHTLQPTLSLLLHLQLLATPLMILHPPIPLRQLRALVNEMACEEKVVLGRHGEGVAHECCGVDC
jgi:hypothetical protein